MDWVTLDNEHDYSLYNSKKILHGQVVNELAEFLKLPWWFGIPSEKRSEEYVNDREKFYYIVKASNVLENDIGKYSEVISFKSRPEGASSPKGRSPQPVSLLIFMAQDYLGTIGNSLYTLNLITMKPTKNSQIKTIIPNDITSRLVTHA